MQLTMVEAEVLTRLARIEGELVEIRKLIDRVKELENWLAWLKGGWAALAAGYLYLFRHFAL